MAKRVLLFCCKGFETLEFAPFVDVFGWASDSFGCDVEIITGGYTKTVVSTFGIPVTVDKTLDEISADDYDAVAVPGGFEEFGFYDEAYDDRFLELIRCFDQQRKCIASICVAALALGKSGILNGRKATTYHLGDGRRQRQLSEFGAVVIPDQSIVIDNNVITSFCPETGPYVAIELLRKLAGEEIANTVGHAMGYDKETPV